MEKKNFATVCTDLIAEIANPSEEWALRSQTAALVAEVWYFRNYEILIYHLRCHRVIERYKRSSVVLGLESHYYLCESNSKN